MFNGSIADRMGRAEACVGAALEHWDAADLVQVDACRTLLEESATHLRVVEELVRAMPDSAGGLVSRILSLKQEIARMMLVVDAGSAFYRGLAIRMGWSGPAYSQGGQFTQDAQACGLHGLEV